MRAAPSSSSFAHAAASAEYNSDSDEDYFDYRQRDGDHGRRAAPPTAKGSSTSGGADKSDDADDLEAEYYDDESGVDRRQLRDWPVFADFVRERELRDPLDVLLVMMGAKPSHRTKPALQHLIAIFFDVEKQLYRMYRQVIVRCSLLITRLAGSTAGQRRRTDAARQESRPVFAALDRGDSSFLLLFFPIVVLLLFELASAPQTLKRRKFSPSANTHTHTHTPTHRWPRCL
ncbi:Hypothetical protein UVM_LOCUS438 [uncultured virus]|nr:Hypothetical protein UVM_LOCUS438 [uncultured virus]